MTNDLREKLFKVTVTLAAGAFAATAKSFFADDLWSVFSGLAVNYASQFSAEVFMPYIKKRWLEHPEEVVNYHIRTALHHSIQTALIEVEAEYFSLDGVSPREQQSLRDFFSILRSRSEREYLDATRDDLESTEVYDYVYHSNDALAHLSDRLRITLNPQSDDYYFTARFIDFFPSRFAEKVQFHFREQLKKGDEAKQALDILFFETLHSGLATLKADSSEIRDALNQVLETDQKALERIDFYGEVWISVIRQNRDHLGQIEQTTAETLVELRATHAEISDLNKQIEKLLRQSVQPGLIHSGRFSDLMKIASDAQRGYEEAKREVIKAQEALTDLNDAVSQSPALAEKLARPLENVREELRRSEQHVLLADGNREHAKRELNEFLESIATTQKQIMSATSQRADEARRFFEAGDFEMAGQALDPSELQRDKAYLLQQKEMVRRELQKLSQDFILKANLCILNKEPDWYEHASQYFQEALASFESTNTCIAFADFLEKHNQHADSIFYYERALSLDSGNTYRVQILNRLGKLYSAVGQFDDVVAAFLEALECLGGKLGEVNLSDKAMTLNNLGIHYSNVGRFDQSESVLSEALEISRKLSEESPRVYLHGVAITLNNLGNIYGTTARFDQAVAVCSEALDIYGKLTKEAHHIYLPYLAKTLNNLGRLYSATSRLPQAESAFIEVLRIRRKLSEDSPRTYLPDLAMILINLGNLYRAQGQVTDAETNYSEALVILLKLSEESPQVYLADVAMTRNNLGTVLVAMGRDLEAEEAFEESLRVRRKLSEASPEVYQSDVATTLTNLGVLYSDTDRNSEAQMVYLEALKIRRKLSKEFPDAYLPDLAVIRNNMGALYAKIGRHLEAEEAFLEALEIRRNLYEESPIVYQLNLTQTFNNLGIFYRTIGRIDEAETCFNEIQRLQNRLDKEP